MTVVANWRALSHNRLRHLRELRGPVLRTQLAIVALGIVAVPIVAPVFVAALVVEVLAAVAAWLNTVAERAFSAYLDTVASVLGITHMRTRLRVLSRPYNRFGRGRITSLKRILREE